MKKLSIIILVLITVFFSSCGKNQVYEQRISLSDYKWPRIEQGKEIKFDKININSTEDAYDIYVEFRHTPYINVEEIKFGLKIISPSGIQKETFHVVKLKDREGKKFIGEAMGDIIDIREVCKQFTFFPEKGEYTIILNNMNDRYETKGLMQIGLDIEKSDLDYDVEKKK